MPSNVPLLYEIPLSYLLVMLCVLFIFIILPMIILPRFLPNLMTNTSNNLGWIEGLRGFAAILVAFNHAPLVLINLRYIPKVFILSQHDFSFLVFLGSLGVQVFFCITGMLFTHKLMSVEQVDWTLFFKKRLLRIVPGYFFACTVALMIAFFITRSHHNISTLCVNIFELLSFGLLPLPTLNGFELNRLLGVNWTLAMEWRFYLILPILFVLFQSARKFTMIVLVGIALGDMMWNSMSSWVYFVSGALCAPLMYRERQKSWTILAYLGLLFTMIVLYQHWENYSNYHIQRWGIMTVLFASLVILKPKFLSLKWVMAMGKVSYSFYLLHAMTLFALLGLCNHYIVDITLISAVSFTLLVGLSLTMATLFATFSFVYIEMPFMTNLKLSRRKVKNPDVFAVENQA